jgi:hypothetical protein
VRELARRPLDLGLAGGAAAVCRVTATREAARVGDRAVVVAAAGGAGLLGFFLALPVATPTRTRRPRAMAVHLTVLRRMYLGIGRFPIREGVLPESVLVVSAASCRWSPSC